MMQDINVGKPGLLFLFLGGFFNFLNHMDKGLVTFIIGSIATLLAIAYYIIQIYKSIKK